MTATRLLHVPRIPDDAEVFLPFPRPRAEVPVVTHFRTTWLASSLAALRERALLDRYFAELPASHHEAIRGSVAGHWAPISLALAHYAACDALGLTDLDLEAIGSEVARRSHGSMFAALAKLGKQTGVTPWDAFAQFHRTWTRVFEGGGASVYRLGPKDALVEVVGWPLSRHRYIQRSMPAVIRAAIEPLCRRAYALHLAQLGSDTRFVMHASWA